MYMIIKAFKKIMIEDDVNRRVFQHPKPIYFITKDFDWDKKTINFYLNDCLWHSLFFSLY